MMCFGVVIDVVSRVLPLWRILPYQMDYSRLSGETAPVVIKSCLELINQLIFLVESPLVAMEKYLALKLGYNGVRQILFNQTEWWKSLWHCDES